MDSLLESIRAHLWAFFFLQSIIGLCAGVLQVFIRLSIKLIRRGIL